MTPFQSTCVIIFAIVAYLMITDKNVTDYLTLVLMMARLNVERVFWMIRLHPKNPITNLMIGWKYDRIAKELKKEFDDALRQTD
jgi:hypothetical protein